MRHPVHFVLHVLVLVFLTTTSFVSSQAWAQAEVTPRPLAVTDIMKFREIKHQVWSESGHVYAYSAVPDRGDATGYVVRLDEASNSVVSEFAVARGTRANITKDGHFVAFLQEPSLLEREQASSSKERRNLPRQVVLINTQTGEQTVFEN